MSETPADPVNDLVLASARIPGGTALYDVHVVDGVVSRLDPSGTPVNPGTRVVDLDGRYVIPGLWDEHVHMTQWALAANRIDLSGAASAGEAADVVRSYLSGPGLAGEGNGTTAVGVGFRDAVWADVPSLELLDGATRGRPTALLSHDLHCVWLNSAAASRYGVAVDASGLLREERAFELTRELGKLPDAVVDSWVRESAQAAAARGIVGIVDFEMTWNRDVWLRRLAGGFDSIRVDAGVYPQDLDRAIAAGMRTGLDVPGGAGLLRVGPLKVLIDGSLNTRTAYCVDPYPHGGHGLLTVSEAELLDLLVRAKESGFVPAVHAIGDAANEVALDAFAAAGIAGRIEHAQFVRGQDFARFGELDLPAESAVALAAGPGLPHIEDVRAIDPLGGERVSLKRGVLFLEDAGRALGQELRPEPLGPQHGEDAGLLRDPLDLKVPERPEPGESVLLQ